MNIFISKFSTSSMHYTYWKSVKSFDSFRRMIERNCPSDTSTLTFAFSRLSQFYKINSHNNNYYYIFKSLESKVIAIPLDKWVGRELSSVTLSLSYFKDWIDRKTVFHVIKLIENYIFSLNALDISHIMRFLGNIHKNNNDLNAELISLLKRISRHIRNSRILGKNSTSANNIVCILSSYAKLDVTDPQLLYTCCHELNGKLDELTKSYEIANALNAISRMASKQSTLDSFTELIICELIARFTCLKVTDCEPIADFLDSLSRLIAHGKLKCIDQLFKVFTETLREYNHSFGNKPKVLRVILRSLRNIDYKHELFIEHCINICKHDYSSWSFGGLCDLISTIGQCDMHKEFINSVIDTKIFNKLAGEMARHRYIPHPDTLTNLIFICQFDYKLLESNKLIHYLLVTNAKHKISLSIADRLGKSVAILLQIKPEITSELDIGTLKWLCENVKFEGVTSYRGDDVKPLITSVERCIQG